MRSRLFFCALALCLAGCADTSDGRWPVQVFGDRPMGLWGPKAPKQAAAAGAPATGAAGAFRCVADVSGLDSYFKVGAREFRTWDDGEWSSNLCDEGACDWRGAVFRYRMASGQGTIEIRLDTNTGAAWEGIGSQGLTSRCAPLSGEPPRS